MMDDMQKNELISALADGQLQGVEFDEALALAMGDSASREAWHHYHLIGDVLRTGEHAAGTVPVAFMSRLQMRMRQEPLPQMRMRQEPLPQVRLQQEALLAHDIKRPAAPDYEVAAKQAANDASFRWKMVAGLASLTAFAAIGWSVVAGSAVGTGVQPQLASAPQSSAPVQAVALDTRSGVMLRDPKLDEFLAAHRQLGGASALQMPAGFLRNATYEGTGR